MKATTRKTKFGKLPDGTPVDLFTLTNANGLVAKITNFGTIITELHVPDRSGKLGNIALGFDNLEQYLKGHPYFGCTVGRVANRIAGGKFTLDGRTYALAITNGPNHLHGGVKGFDKVVWKAEPQEGAAVRFRYTSPDGEEGYPGTLDVTVTMKLTDADELSLDYVATTDKPTPVNLTNHSYFNLAGSGTVFDHTMIIVSDAYTPSDANLIPSGEIRPVKGTPMDFTRPTAIGARFSELKTDPPGYDNNFILRKGGNALALAARAEHPATGRGMEVYTTEPAIQFYTANFLDGSLKGTGGVVYERYSGFCLEAQHYPDSVHQPAFPSIILRPGQTYRQTTIHKFLTIR